MAYKKIVCLLLVTILLVLPASANHQMSFSTDKAAYIRGQGNVVLTLQDADNDGAFVGWDGIAIYDVVGTEVANFDDNWQGQGHPIQAGKNLVWNWGQKYDVRAGAQNANNNGQLVPLGDYQAKIEPVNYGSHGHLLDLKFKKSFWSWFDQSNRYVLEVGDASEDMKDWLGSSNFNSLCEYAPKSLICSNNIKK